MKPILFNTDMVRAILAGRKSVTRRVVKPRYCDSVFEMFGGELCEASPYKPPIENGDGTTTRFVRQYAPCEPPYCPGDILYVRETWCKTDCFGLQNGFVYKANNNSILEQTGFIPKWRPSIHMPREAARIFLRVTDVRVERLQDSFSEHGSTIFHLQKEGINIGGQCRACITAYGRPCCSDDESECGVLDEVRSEFSDLWDSTLKKADRALYGWDANPYVWVIGFERISKEDVPPEELAR